MGAGNPQSRGRIRPSPVRTYVRETQGRGAGGGTEAALRVRLVSRAYRAGAERGQVVGERVGTGSRTPRTHGRGASAAVRRAADALAARLALRASASLRAVSPRTAPRVLQSPRRRSAVVVQNL